MKLRLNKLMAGLVLAGGALALVGCGGGDTPTLVVKGNVVAPVTPETAATARNLVQATSGAQFALPTGFSFANTVSGGTPGTVPAGTKLQINAKAGATGNQLGTFAVTASDGKVEGNLLTGSCKFEATTVTSATLAAQGWVVGSTYTVTPCALTLVVTNTALGGKAQVPFVLTLKDTEVTAENPVEITVEAGTGNTAVIKVGDTVVTEKPLPTGGSPT